MAQAGIESREFKIMLKASRFDSSEGDLVEHADRFWSEFGPAVATAPGGAVRTSKNLDTIDDDKRRKIRFFDTKNDLSRCARLRVPSPRTDQRQSEGSDAEVPPAKTTGCAGRRHGTGRRRRRRLQRHQGLQCKFEEDIKRGSSIVSLYSVSTTKKIDSDKKINRMSDAGKIVAGLQQALNAEYQPEKRLKRVGKYTAQELSSPAASSS